jgi:hypothetical protein
MARQKPLICVAVVALWSDLSSAGPLSQELLLPNGDFEGGSTVWTEFALHGLPLILESGSLPVAPYSGSWAAWLGGDFDGISELSQSVLVPAHHPVLRFQYFAASEEQSCFFDFARVFVDGEQIDELGLCNSAGFAWLARSIDLSSFVGDSPVEIKVRVVTDDSLNSNFFVDDFRFYGPNWIFGDDLEDADYCGWSSAVPECTPAEGPELE